MPKWTEHRRINDCVQELTIVCKIQELTEIKKMIKTLLILICVIGIIYPIYKISYHIGYRNGYKQCVRDTFNYMVDEGT